MKSKFRLSLIFFIVFSFFSFQKTFSQCFQIESILVDACGQDEGYNEMVRFKVGTSNINTSNLDVTWANTQVNWQGLVQNAITTSTVNALNAQIALAGGCGRLVQPSGGVLPANAKVILVTSFNLDVVANAFGAISEDIYIIFQNNPDVTAGHFVNYSSGSSTRTLSISFGSCSDSVTYDKSLLININGTKGGGSALNDGATVNFTPSNTATYINNGCVAPVEVFTVDAGNSPISACPGVTVSLTGMAQGQQSVNWSVTPNSGSFSSQNTLDTNYFISPSASGTITLTLTATNSCNVTKFSTVTLNINSSITPTFNQIEPICPGGNLEPLPTTSTNNITGIWSPTLNNTITTTYLFVPDSGQCASSANMTIDVNFNIQPTFNAVDPVCIGENISQLPTTSTNNITGSWKPAINNLATTTYTFSPNANQCATSTTLIIMVDPGVIPTFDQVAPICSGGTLLPLPTTSLNNITGSWKPEINNLATTTYTFTPNTSSSPSTNLVVNGDFSSGNTGFSTDYQYLVSASAGGNQKAYGIVTTANSWFQFFPACTGHSPTSGNILVADGSTSNSGNDVVWEQTVAVVPNQNYTLSYWLQTLATPNLAIIDLKINGISIGIETAPSVNCEWKQYSYVWNSGSNTTAQITISDKVIVSDGNDFALDDISFTPNYTQCPLPTTLTVTVSSPSVSITASCKDANYTLSAIASDSNATFKWYKGTAALDETSNTLIIKTSDVYKVVVTEGTCTAEATENVTSFYCGIPKGISPNGDKKNDYFDLSNFSVSKLEIFNRYGMKVYTKSNYKTEWNGTTDSGQELPDATYYYVVEFESGKIETGWVYINR